jgi:hypothetical protein
MRDSAGRGRRLDLVVLLEALQSVPEAYASAEQDRDQQLSDSARQIYAATYGDPPDPPATTALIEIPSSLARQSELDDVRDRS